MVTFGSRGAGGLLSTPAFFVVSVAASLFLFFVKSPSNPLLETLFSLSLVVCAMAFMVSFAGAMSFFSGFVGDLSAGKAGLLGRRARPGR